MIWHKEVRETLLEEVIWKLKTVQWVENKKSSKEKEQYVQKIGRRALGLYKSRTTVQAEGRDYMMQGTEGHDKNSGTYWQFASC